MTQRNKLKISERKVAIGTGVALLMMAVAAFWVTDFLGRLMNIKTHNLQSVEILLRNSILGWTFILITDIWVAWGLHIFFKKKDQGLSLLTAWFRLIYSIILGIAISNLVLSLLLLNRGNELFSEIENDQMVPMVLFFINGFKEIWSFGLIIFGLHLLGLGYLTFKSGVVPKVWSILLTFAALGYIITNVGSLLLSTFENYKHTIEILFILPMILGEMGLAIWLLLKGGKEKNDSIFSHYSFSDSTQ